MGESLRKFEDFPDGGVENADESELYMAEDLKLSLRDGVFKLKTEDSEEKNREKQEKIKRLAKKLGYKLGDFKLDENFNDYRATISEKKHLRVVGEIIGALAQYFQNLKENGGEKFEEINEKIKSSEFQESLKNFLDVRKIFGTRVATFGAGMGAAMGVKFLVKTALGGGTGIVAGAAVGAISGAVLEGVKNFISESKRIRENPLAKKEFETKIQKIGKEKIKSTEKMDRYLEIADSRNPELFAEKKDLWSGLYRELDFKSEKFGAFLKGAWQGGKRGGFYGALGGLVTYLLTDLSGHSGEAPEISGSAQISKGDLAGAALPDPDTEIFKIREAAVQTYTSSHAGSLASGLEDLNSRVFKISLEKGEGLTNAARKLLHDFIAEQNALGKEISLSREQMVFAEDYYLKHFLEGKLEPGMLHPDAVIEGSGNGLFEAVKEAQNLKDTSNLKEFAAKVLDKEWDRMSDYHAPFNPANNFAEEILNNASDRAALMTQKAADDMSIWLAHHDKSSLGGAAATKAAEEVKDWWLKKTGETLLSVGGAAGALGALFYTDRYYRNRNRKKREDEKVVELTEVVEPVPEAAREIENKISEPPAKVPENNIRRAPALAQKEIDELLKEVVSEPGSNPVFKTLEAEKESAVTEDEHRVLRRAMGDAYISEQKKGFGDFGTNKESSIDKKGKGEIRNNEKDKEKEKEKEKRILNDEVYLFLKGNMIRALKPGQIHYEIPIRKKGEIVRNQEFSNYTSLFNWIAHLPVEEKKFLMKHGIRVVLPGDFQERIDSNPKLKKYYREGVSEILEKIFKEKTEVQEEMVIKSEPRASIALSAKEQNMYRQMGDAFSVGYSKDNDAKGVEAGMPTANEGGDLDNLVISRDVSNVPPASSYTKEKRRGKLAKKEKRMNKKGKKFKKDEDDED